MVLRHVSSAGFSQIGTVSWLLYVTGVTADDITKITNYPDEHVIIS